MRYGSTGDQVDRLRVVFAQGEVADLGFEPWPEFEAEPTDFKDLIVRKLQTLFRRSQARLERMAPAVPRNRAGYGLLRGRERVGHPPRPAGGWFRGDPGDRAPGGAANGSAAGGTGSRPAPVRRSVRRRGVRDRNCWILRLAPSSCDLFDRRSLSLARDADASFRGWIDEAAEAVLTVEFEGDDPDVVADKVRLLGERAIRTRALVSEPFATLKRSECERLLGLRRLVEPLLMRFRGRARPVSFIDDVAVPPDRLAPVLQRLQSLLQQHNVTWTLDAYAGEGRLRLRPFLDLADPGDRAKLEPLANRVYDIVLEAGGTISSARAAAWSARSSSVNNTASWSRFSARSRTPSTRRTSSIPARSSATTPT